MKVGIVYHEKYTQYDLGPGHPFTGDRFVNVKRFFEERGLFRLPDVVTLTPEPATSQDLLSVHDEDYVDLIFRLAVASKPYDIETPVSPQILEAALLIIGGPSRLGGLSMSGESIVPWLWVVAIITLAETTVVVSVCSMTLQCLWRGSAEIMGLDAF